MTEPKDLDTLLAIAHQQDAEKSGSEKAQTEVLYILANAGGALPVTELLTRYGVSKKTLALLCDKDLITDKRQKVRVLLSEVDGVAIAYLSSSGWQATGRTRGQTIHPTSDSLKHALGPSRLAEWCAAVASTIEPHGVSVSVTWGSSCRNFSKVCEALAWANLKTHADPTGGVGLVTGSLIPDALIVERYRDDELGKQLFTNMWGVPPHDRDMLGEHIIGVEVQSATRQAGDPLKSKVDAWSAVIETLRAASGVLWIVENGAARVLTGLGVGDASRRPGQMMVSTGAVGLGGNTFEVPGKRWWMLDVPRI